MTKIRDAFKDGKAFIPFLTCGDPDLETTEKLVCAGLNEKVCCKLACISTFSSKSAYG